MPYCHLHKPDRHPHSCTLAPWRRVDIPEPVETLEHMLDCPALTLARENTGVEGLPMKTLLRDPRLLQFLEDAELLLQGAPLPRRVAPLRPPRVRFKPPTPLGSILRRGPPPMRTGAPAPPPAGLPPQHRDHQQHQRPPKTVTCGPVTYHPGDGLAELKNTAAMHVTRPPEDPANRRRTRRRA